MSKLHSRESTAPKMKGAGDGLKTAVRLSERTPVPSSRKFTPTPIRDTSIQLKLKKVLDEMDAKQGKLKKAKSVAEITPTKSKHRRPRRPDATVLHATPRPPADEVSETPSRRPNEERRLERLVYQRMLLFVWRRNRARLTMLSESLRRRQDQVLKLEKQVDCLKDLNQSECDKRNEAINERQRVEIILQNLRTENENLHNEKIELQNEINQLQNMLRNNTIDVENTKNDINSKNTYLKRLENEIQKQLQLIKSLQEEKTAIVDKMKEQDVAIKLQSGANERMSQAVEKLENELKNRENAKMALISDFNDVTQQYRLEIKKREDALNEIKNLKSIEEEMRNKIYDLEEKLAKMTDNCATLSSQLKDTLKWWQNIKDFAFISWAVLQNAAYIMLPAL